MWLRYRNMGEMNFGTPPLIGVTVTMLCDIFEI